MVIHHVTFSGPERCVSSTQKRSQYKEKQHTLKTLLFHVSSYNTHNQKLHQSVAHNSLSPKNNNNNKKVNPS